MSVPDESGTEFVAQVIEANAKIIELQAQLDAEYAKAVISKENVVRLVTTLREAHDQIIALKEEVDRLAEPPCGFGIFVQINPDDTADIFTGGRKLRVNVSPAVEAAELRKGQEVLLNEALSIIKALGFINEGELVTYQETLEDGERVLVNTGQDEKRVVRLSDSLIGVQIRSGDSLLLDDRSGYVYEKIADTEVEELVLEEVPDIRYEDIGGLFDQIEAIRDAIELPYLHAEKFKRYKLKKPKGILLYGPPGCGKTLVAKAVANALVTVVREKTGQEGGRAFFLNIKGPELLNKYVGETERHIRLVFQRARALASEGWPVIVFFDEMDAIFRTRGSGVSSDVENTIVPQFLAELDGVEALGNVIVIGASNREDMIDPAVLRPGRLDVKIKVGRPDPEGARDILSKYLTADLPLHADDLARHNGDREETVRSMIFNVVEQLFEETKDNQFIEVTYQNGDPEVLFYKDFLSGAMLENVVSRAKKLAVKDEIGPSHQPGIREGHMRAAVVEEFKSNEDLPNTTNPDDWARISGKKGQKIVYMRVLRSGTDPAQGTKGQGIDTIRNTGQYL